MRSAALDTVKIPTLSGRLTSWQPLCSNFETWYSTPVTDLLLLLIQMDLWQDSLFVTAMLGSLSNRQEVLPDTAFH